MTIPQALTQIYRTTLHNVVRIVISSFPYMHEIKKYELFEYGTSISISKDIPNNTKTDLCANIYEDEGVYEKDNNFFYKFNYLGIKT